MSPNKKLTPNLDQESTKQINLAVLQRIDPSVEEILITAAHVTLYDFDIDRTEWSRKDVEGSLFVVKRNTQPRFQFIVMNQRNTDNLVENLLGDFEFEVQVPYLLYRNAAQEVNGIWFYKSQDCEAVANLFNRIINAYSKVSPKIEASSAKSGLDESEKLPTITVSESPLEPIASKASAIIHAPKDSFVNLCSATSIVSTPHVTNPVQIHQHFPVPIFSRSPHLQTTPVLEMQSPTTLPTLSTQSLPFPDTSNTSVINRSTNLVNPSVFLRPPPSSTLMIPPNPSKPIALRAPASLQRPYGAPLLQPFPPPVPPFTLTPITQSNVPPITREKVRDMLMKLVQNPQFTDMFYEELLKGIS